MDTLQFLARQGLIRTASAFRRGHSEWNKVTFISFHREYETKCGTDKKFFEKTDFENV